MPFRDATSMPGASVLDQICRPSQSAGAVRELRGKERKLTEPARCCRRHSRRQRAARTERPGVSAARCGWTYAVPAAAAAAAVFHGRPSQSRGGGGWSRDEVGKRGETGIPNWEGKGGRGRGDAMSRLAEQRNGTTTRSDAVSTMTRKCVRARSRRVERAAARGPVRAVGWSCEATRFWALSAGGPAFQHSSGLRRTGPCRRCGPWRRPWRWRWCWRLLLALDS